MSAWGQGEAIASEFPHGLPESGPHARQLPYAADKGKPFTQTSATACWKAGAPVQK